MEDGDKIHNLEGIPQSRCRFAGDLNRYVSGDQNYSMKYRADDQSAISLSEEYKFTFDLVELETIEAQRRGDTSWIEDLGKVLDSIQSRVMDGPNSAEFSSGIIRRAKEIWEKMESIELKSESKPKPKPESVSDAIVSKIKNLLSKRRDISSSELGRWNSAIDMLSSDAKTALIAFMKEQKKRDENYYDSLLEEISSATEMRERLGFDKPNTVYTNDMQDHINTIKVLKDINDVMIENKCDTARRGQFWSELILL